jgi:hypothetical protein
MEFAITGRWPDDSYPDLLRKPGVGAETNKKPHPGESEVGFFVSGDQ